MDGIVNFFYPGYVQSGVSRWSSGLRSRFQKENDQIVDPYVQVREDAVLAIGKVVTGGVSTESRANAARAVGILRGKAAVPDLVHALQSKDDQLIFESLLALQKISDQTAGPKVMFLLRDLQPRIQIAAIETVGLLRTREAIPALQRVLDNPRNDRVRKAALSALAMMPDPSSKPYFDRALSDKTEGIRVAGYEGLGRLKDRDHEADMAASFAEEPRVPVRLAQAFALVKLGQTGTEDSAPLVYLVETLNSRSYKGVAEPYLGELARDTSVRKALYSYLRQGTNREKIGIAHVLSTSGDPAAVPQLEQLTNDPDGEVAQQSTLALRNLRARLQ